MIILGAPTDLPGCLLWLDASDSASVIRDGSNVVSQWSDKSGNANHATEANPTNRPTYGATAFGGLPGIDWGNGSVAARALTTPSISYGVFTVFVVVRGDASSNYVYVHESDSGSNREYIHGDPNPNINIRRGGVQSMRAVVLPYTTTTGVLNRDGVRRIITRRYGGTHATNTVRVDLATPQTNVISGQFFDPGTGASNGPIYLGNRQAYDNPLRGVLAEFIVFNRYLSDGDVALVEQYLSRKWAIAPARLIASPLDLPGLTLWWDANDAGTFSLDGSSGVVSWTDKVRGVAFAQATQANRPVYNAANASLGGNGSVDFVGTNNSRWLATAAFTAIAHPFTGFVAGKNDVQRYSILLDYNNVTSGRIQFAARVSPARYTLFAGAPTLTGALPSGLIAPKYVASFTMDSSRSSIRENGQPLIRSATGAQSCDSLSMGALVDGTTGAIEGSIAEVLLYARRLTEGEIALVEAYLRRKLTI